MKLHTLSTIMLAGACAILVADLAYVRYGGPSEADEEASAYAYACGFADGAEQTLAFFGAKAEGGEEKAPLCERWRWNARAHGFKITVSTE